MSQEFTLIVAGDPISAEQADALYAAGLDDGTVITRDGVSRIEVDREADSMESAIRSAIGQASDAGLTVARVEIEADQFAGAAS